MNPSNSMDENDVTNLKILVSMAIGIVSVLVFLFVAPIFLIASFLWK